MGQVPSFSWEPPSLAEAKGKWDSGRMKAILEKLKSEGLQKLEAASVLGPEAFHKTLGIEVGGLLQQSGWRMDLAGEAPKPPPIKPLGRTR